jgi:hypothetical protein
LRSFFSNYSWALLFWGKNIGTKAAGKMLMKLIKDFHMSDRSYFDTFVGEGSSVLD